MKKIMHKYKNAFTLMEIGISLLIVSILVMLSVPLITNQIKKTDEYSYYAAFKTVEKMGSQIVAFGDPEGSEENNNDDSSSSEGTSDNNSNEQSGDVSAQNLGNNSNLGLNFSINIKNGLITKFVDNVFKILNPRAFAQIQTSELVSFPSYEYDYVRVCLGNPHVIKDSDAYAGNTWSEAEIETVQKEPLCVNYYSKEDFIKKRFMCKNMSSSEIKAMLAVTNLSAQEYCKFLAQNCFGAYDCQSDKKSCYKEILLSQTQNIATYGECVISVKDPDLDYEQPTLGINNDDNSYSADVSCEMYGFTGMSSSSSNSKVLPCSCDNVNTFVTLNNRNVCCPAPEDGKYPYYAGKLNPCLNCAYGAFNEKTKLCCPNNSTYSASLGKCVCSEGYTPNAENTICNISGSTCPAGSHLASNNTCVSNSPIIHAKRLCELVSYNWNVSTHNCNTFKEAPNSNITYNDDLLNAITKNNTPYLSAKAVVGAFNDIEPNIVFANGLRMWILGDKSASIAGLSYNSDDYTPELNVCSLKTGVSENNCNSEIDYYCKNDAKCFTLDPGNATVKLSDARNCCSSVDYSDLIYLYEGNDYLKDARTYAINGFTVFIDINGTKDNDEVSGGGTLWKDVFPFYISSNGNVYPGYPLNAAKAGTDKTYDSSSLFQGGNSSALSADVYYYGIVNGKRKKVNVYPSIPYARALCLSTNISAYTPYCQNLGSKFRKSHTPIDLYIYSDANPCYKHRCFVKLKNKIKFL